MMKASDLDILLQEGEGVMLEYKESLSSSIAREIAAFANTAGGRILLGVRDDGTVKGIADTNELRARIQDIARNCDPPVKILLQHIGEVTVVTIHESEKKPVQCSDGFFWRQGAVTQKLSREEIRDFFRHTGAIRFDLSICQRFHYPDDFDLDKFNDWLRKSTITRGGSVKDILVNIEAAERSGGDLVFRNTGVLFFALNPRRFFNQAYVTCLLFKGASKMNVLDRKDFAGGIVADIEDSLRFIERNTRTAYRIEKLTREEIPEYPMAALREAITNAVMHRDWFLEGANVFVEIFEDRIEISNPGGLPNGMLPEDLGSKSVRRNPLIADLLHRIAFVEKAGTGIRRMRDGARAQGYPEPEFSSSSFFTAVFRPIVSRHPSSTPQVPLKYPPSTPQVLAILKAVASGEKTREELQEVSGITDRKHFRKQYIEALISLHYLEWTIPSKPRSSKQRYRITAEGRKALEASLKEAGQH
ncbi:MAG: ATP-binding protein [Candidatus Xenobiia bacterium LiM19]